MLIESLAGLVAVRRRLVAVRFGDAVGEPLLGGAVFGLAACGALACDPQVDDFSHAKPQWWIQLFCAKCADTVALRTAMCSVHCCQNAVVAVNWKPTVGCTKITNVIDFVLRGPTQVKMNGNIGV
jgi:hypothetical protein